jgi:hypothetical protein
MGVLSNCYLLKFATNALYWYLVKRINTEIKYLIFHHNSLINTKSLSDATNLIWFSETEIY